MFKVNQLINLIDETNKSIGNNKTDDDLMLSIYEDNLPRALELLAEAEKETTNLLSEEHSIMEWYIITTEIHRRKGHYDRICELGGEIIGFLEGRDSRLIAAGCKWYIPGNIEKSYLEFLAYIGIGGLEAAYEKAQQKWDRLLEAQGSSRIEFIAELERRKSLTKKQN